MLQYKKRMMANRCNSWLRVFPPHGVLARCQELDTTKLERKRGNKKKSTKKERERSTMPERLASSLLKPGGALSVASLVGLAVSLQFVYELVFPKMGTSAVYSSEVLSLNVVF